MSEKRTTQYPARQEIGFYGIGGHTMEIRKAQPADLDRIMEIYRAAKLFMDRTGNPTQWVDGYPRRGVGGTGDTARGLSSVHR